MGVVMEQVLDEELNFDVSNAADGYMRTYTGIQFSPLNPDPKTVNIYDIAHALSLICRWGGHLKQFYSVAQHCLLVSELCEPQNQLIGLLHDAAEAYIGDMIRPLKYLKHMHNAYKVVESRVENAIATSFGLKSISKTHDAEIADVVVLAWENKSLVLKSRPWAEETLNKYPMFGLKTIVPWPSEVAEAKYLEKFEQLTKNRFK